MNTETQWIAFADGQKITQGAPRDVAMALKNRFEKGQGAMPLIFDAHDGRQVDFNPRDLSAVSEPTRSVGRPRLGVVPREVTLLPRHWEWLAAQSGGASVTLRKLVEHAMRTHQFEDQVRLAQEAAYRFMSAMAGNEAGFEAAARALFAGNHAALMQASESWPQDVRQQTLVLAGIETV